ncbi:MAG: FliG C-terminal domain-containing protein [Isosphaeraceae bacterium]
MTASSSVRSRSGDLDGVENRESNPDGFAPSNSVSVAQLPPLRKAAIVLVSLEQSLTSQLLANLDRAAVEAVTMEIARLERIDPAEQAAVLDEFLGLGLRRVCFVFDDLVRMSDRDIRKAYKHEAMGTWALAIAGAAAPVRAKILGSLEPASASALRRFLEGMGPFRLSDAEAAQAEIAEWFRRLHDRGSVSLPDPSGRDEVLV